MRAIFAYRRQVDVNVWLFSPNTNKHLLENKIAKCLISNANLCQYQLFKYEMQFSSFFAIFRKCRKFLSNLLIFSMSMLQSSDPRPDRNGSIFNENLSKQLRESPYCVEQYAYTAKPKFGLDPKKAYYKYYAVKRLR